MNRKWIFIFWLGMASCGAWAQGFNDVLGVHDMTPMGKSPIKGRVSGSCLYCHAPHSAMAGPMTPLWNQQLSVQTYSNYSSTTYHQTGFQPPIGSPTKLCLSCHDGTVAPGQTVAFGKLIMTGSMKATSKFGGDLRSSHPVSMKTPLVDSPVLNAGLSSSPANTADPQVKLVKGTVECSTCHDPHVQRKDVIVQDFLVRDNSGGALCLACHDPTRVVNGNVNYLGGWAVSAHAKATNTTSNQPYVGGYGTVATNACTSCHMPHNAAGPARLLRGNDEQRVWRATTADQRDPAAPNVFVEFAKTVIRLPSGTNTHDRTESDVLNNNRHATCVDCHNPHASSPVSSFAAPPAIRPSQNSVVGISAADSLTVLKPAINQYENCLRCHGASAGKTTDKKFGYLPVWAASAGDPLNIVPQFAAACTLQPSCYPRSKQRSAATQPAYADAQSGRNHSGPQYGRTHPLHRLPQQRRQSGVRWALAPTVRTDRSTCTCSNVTMNSVRRPAPGQAIVNLFPSPDLTANGPYALCAKCHDLNQILANTSFSEHARHINDGFSCSTCHTAAAMVFFFAARTATSPGRGSSILMRMS